MFGRGSRRAVNFRLCRSAMLVGAVLLCVQARADDAPDNENCCCTQDEISACLADALKRADDTVYELYRGLMKKLGNADERARLREAQHAWSAFREKSCLYEVGPNDRTRGTRFPVEQTECLSKYTKQRVEQLQEYLKKCGDHGC